VIGVVGHGPSGRLRTRAVGLAVEVLDRAKVGEVVSERTLPPLRATDSSAWGGLYRTWMLDRMLVVAVEPGAQGLVTLRLILSSGPGGEELERMVVQGDEGAFLWDTSLPRALDRIAGVLKQEADAGGQAGQGGQTTPSASAGALERGWLQVSSQAGRADLTLSPVGKHPLTGRGSLQLHAPARVRLPVGRYSLRLDKQGFDSLTRTVHVKAGGTHTHIALQPKRREPAKRKSKPRRRRRERWKMIDISGLHAWVGTDLTSGHPLVFGHGVTTPTMSKGLFYLVTARLGVAVELLGEPVETHWGPFVGTIPGVRFPIGKRKEIRVGAGPAVYFMFAEWEVDDGDGTDVRLAGVRPGVLGEMVYRVALGRRGDFALHFAVDWVVTRVESRWFVAPLGSVRFTFAD